MTRPLSSLPIDALRPELEAVWSHHRNFILQAPTGSGKSTRIPRFLLEWKGFPAGQTIIILQPRRMAARMLARRVASELGQTTGQTVGYQIRFEGLFGKETRLLYVTEGLLLRRLMGEKGLEGVGAILFDEFHERHVEGDVALGLAVRAQEGGWKGRIGIFSATLETDRLDNYLPDAQVLRSEGRQFPVECTHLGGEGTDPVWERAARGVERALSAGAEGDILIFMPGKYEIERSLGLLETLRTLKGWDLFSLHGELDPARQDAAVETGIRPRVVVATNIAETSLTLPGIRTVIDSGLVRMADFDARRGVNTLLTEKISRASADQRAGRAGRVAPGRCFRLWSENDHVHRSAYTSPEISRLDLSEIFLQLMAAEALDGYPWFEAPPPEAARKAHLLLEDLGAAKFGKITGIGRQMATFPLHPRYSRILIEAGRRNCPQTVARMIAISEGRRILSPISDRRRMEVRESWWEGAAGFSDSLRDILIWNRVRRAGDPAGYCREWGLNWGAFRNAERVYGQLTRILGREAADGEWSLEDFGKSLLVGYVDQLARRLDRGTLRCQMVHQRRGELRRDSLAADASLVIATDLEEREYRGEAVLFLGGATRIEPEWLQSLFPEDFQDIESQRLDPAMRRVVKLRQETFRDLILSEKLIDGENLDGAEIVLAQGIQENNWVMKQWNEEAENWIRRLNTLVHYYPELEIAPILPSDRLLLLEQICAGARSYKEVKDRPVLPVLKSWLSDALLPLLDEWVPERFPLPCGSRPKLRYDGEGRVVLPARIQQLYDVPGKMLRICQNRCPLRVEILAPNNRPVQVTDNLDAFWEGQYPAIRKALFGRYPKHEWR